MVFIKESTESPRIFKSDLLDAFSRTHWVVVPLLFAPTIALLMWYSVFRMDVGVFTSMLLAGVGWFVWTFVEYGLHRTVFHWVPKVSWGKRIHFLMHGVHHDMPRDKYRLVMPPLVSITLFFVFLGLWLVLFGKYAWAFHGGFVFGYMVYDIIHYHVHHGRTRFRWLRRLKKHHYSHHFAPGYDERRFGVSTRFWDRLFGTDAIPAPASDKTTTAAARVKSRERVRGRREQPG